MKKRITALLLALLLCASILPVPVFASSDLDASYDGTNVLTFIGSGLPQGEYLLSFRGGAIDIAFTAPIVVGPDGAIPAGTTLAVGQLSHNVTYFIAAEQVRGGDFFLEVPWQWGEYALVTFSIAGAAPFNGTLTASIGGTSINSNTSHPVGDSVLFTAAPAAGFRVSQWAVTAGGTTDTITVPATATGAQTLTRAVVSGGLNVVVTFLALDEELEPVQLSAPTNLRQDGTFVRWNAVPNAISYRVYVDGVIRGTAQAVGMPSFNLAPLGLVVGSTYTVSVVAVGDGVAFLDSPAATVQFTMPAPPPVTPEPPRPPDQPPRPLPTPRPPGVPAEPADPEDPPDVAPPDDWPPTIDWPFPDLVTIVPASQMFTDVAPGSWYYWYVSFAVSHGLFQGVEPGRLFGPDYNMTRAMFVQVLANMEGVNLAAWAGGTPAFSDIAPADWFFPAVQWAAAEGITVGMGDGTFAPNIPMTREMIAVMLHRYVQHRNISLPTFLVEPFVDQADVSYWAAQSVAAMQAARIIQGDAGRFFPRATATRAEVAAIFSRFYSILLIEELAGQ